MTFDQWLFSYLFETSETQGTGTLNLGGAVTGYDAFSDEVGDGKLVYYVITQEITDGDGNITSIEREIGLGTLTHGSPDTLSRDVVLRSTNSDAAVDFGSGTKNVFCAPPAGTYGGKLLDVQVFSSSGTYTPHDLCRYAVVEVKAGGGGGGGVAGGGSSTVACAGGGGEGGYSKHVVQRSDMGATETVTVGAGGAGGSAGNNDGSGGGTSAFGAHCSASGGGDGDGDAGGAAVEIGGIGGSGGVGSSGTINVRGTWGSPGIVLGANRGIAGSGAMNGARGPLSVVSATGATAGVNGTLGQGGSGAYTGGNSNTAAGGNGGDGYVIVWEYA